MRVSEKWQNYHFGVEYPFNGLEISKMLLYWTGHLMTNLLFYVPCYFALFDTSRVPSYVIFQDSLKA